MIMNAPCKPPNKQSKGQCQKIHCPLSEYGTNPFERFGLMWVGEMYYTPRSFTLEAARMGVSKRLGQVPKDLHIGVDWVLLAHPKACPGEMKGEYEPRIFYAFKPSAIEYIVNGKETKKELDKLEKRGFTLVKLKSLL